MAIITGMAGGASTVPLCTIPPGPCDVVLTAVSGTAYVGPGTAVSSVNGLVVSGAAPTSFHAFPGSQGARLYVAAGGGTVSYLISTSA